MKVYGEIGDQEYLYISSDNIRFFDQINYNNSNDSTIKQMLLSGSEYAFLENQTYYYAVKLQIQNCTEWQYSRIFNELLIKLLFSFLPYIFLVLFVIIAPLDPIH